MFEELSAWQVRNQISNSQLASMIGVHRTYIAHLKAGRRKWSPVLANKVQEESGGQVPRDTLLYPHDKSSNTNLISRAWARLKRILLKKL